MYYIARYYDRTVGMFVGCPLGADTLVPDPTHIYDYHRYGYGRLNPLKYNEPSDHCVATAASVAGALVSGGGSLALSPSSLAFDAACWAAVVAAIQVSNHLADNPPAFPELKLPGGNESYPLTVAEPQIYAQPVGGELEVGVTIQGTSADSTLQIGNLLADPLPGVDPTGHIYAAGTGFIDPTKVRFSQNSVGFGFTNGGTIDDLANGLRSGSITPQDVPAIRLVEKDGALYTLDNRRLEAFRRAGVNVPFRMATSDEIEKEKWKFTTKNNGVSVRVRGPR